LAVLALLGGGGGGLLSAILFLFRDQCEPLVSIVLPLLARALGGHLDYDPSEYWFIAGWVGFLALLWSIGIGWTIIRKPAEDRRVDRILREKLEQSARGAPLEPL
jgi:hypothetical protein